MIIVIDGYNLLKKISKKTNVSEQERSGLISNLGRYAKKRNHKIEIIFDAGPCTYPMQERDHGIMVIYSGIYKTADDLVVSFVQDHGTKQIVVVTEDREILNALKPYSHVESIGPEAFYEKVKIALEGQQVEKKLKDKSIKKLLIDNIYREEQYSGNDEIDLLMYEAASMKAPDKDIQENIVPRHHAAKGTTISKKKRMRNRAIDKL